MQRRRRVTQGPRIRGVRDTILLLVAGLATGAAFADACTYGEALMALEQGNTMRGMALMHMAGNDGDRRATDYLARDNFVVEVSLYAPSSIGYLAESDVNNADSASVQYEEP